MAINCTPLSQSQNYLDVLNHMLELAMQTADAASVEKNHKLVLQAVREVTRLVTLINKLTSSTAAQKTAAQPGPALEAPSKAKPQSISENWGKSGKIPGKTKSIEEFFKENKQDIFQGKNFLKAAASKAGANPETREGAGAAAAIHRQDESVILAPEEAEAV